MTAAETFLVIVDDTPECRKALRFAALRALHTKASVALLNVRRPAQFLQWGRVQDMMEAEAQADAEAALGAAADLVESIHGRRPVGYVRRGKPAEQILAFLADDPSIRVLVLAAAARGRPGPLVDYFSGEAAGTLPCIVMIVPGGISDEALDRLT
jgi:nucleotide-binding universal stress UspA family protein